MKNRIYIGIDTSNYTTSLAAVDEAGSMELSERQLLKVAEGGRGLRQSDALFAHTVNLPILFERFSSKLSENFGDYEIAAFGVSATPRRAEGSYMPCFLAGISAATSAALSCKKPLYRFSHQEGHIAAAIFGSHKTKRPFDDECGDFYAFHMSGGTCELVRVRASDGRYNSDIVAKTLDITAGQLIDRSGVKLGLKFPCGAELERLAEQSNKHIRISISGDGKGSVNLSGFENRFDSLNGSDCDRARFIFEAVSAALSKMLTLSGAAESGLPVLFAGGVMSSHILKDDFSDNGNYYFTTAEYAGDNAVGTALLARRSFLLRGNKND